jgi:chitodextrinase
MAFFRSMLAAGLLLEGALLAQNPPVAISVDVNANRHAINPNIYGVAYGDATTLADLNSPLNRQGGNNTTRYNWQLNGDNRANDWFFESIGDSSSVAAERGDTFIAMSKSAGAQAMLTIPMIGWVAKFGVNRSKLASFSIAKYGAQTGNDWQWFSDAGNGVSKSTGQNITGNDPNDANIASDSSYQQQWVHHLVTTWGNAGTQGLRYYILDNEHSIWHSTHRDVHPTGATMAEIRDKIVDYAGKIRAIDSGASIVGPEEWGWSGYLLSGYDQQYGSLHGWGFLPDRNNNGGWDYLPWLLNQLKQSTASSGVKYLDVFSVHYYPQGGEFSNDTSSNMQLRRNRSTRSLWDPTYVDETWINDKVQLIPRLKNWVNTYYYPGTPVAITEYNWGAESYIGGATAQADILGIFGREGLDMATRWTTPDASTPTYKAMKMYRNYDGNKSGFGDMSVLANAPNPDNVAAFAAQRSSSGALTVLVISKYLSGSTPITLNLSNFPASGASQVWQLTSANVITRLADVPYSGGALSATLPALSVTLFVLPKSAGSIPQVVISAAPVSGTAPLAVSFSGVNSTDLGGTITSYSWNFGDGSTASGVSASHTYTAAGTFQARLTVADNLGATSSAAKTIAVSAFTINAPNKLAASLSNHVVTLRWTDNSTNEDGFYVERAPAGTTNFVRIGQTDQNISTYNDSPGRGVCLYRVQAFNIAAKAVSAYSNRVQVRVK